MKGMFKRALGVVASMALAATGVMALTGAAEATVRNECGENKAACTITLTGSAAQITNHKFKYVKVASYDVYGASPQETLTLVTNPKIYSKVVKAVESATNKTVPTDDADTKVDPLAWAQQQDSPALDQSETEPWFGTDGSTRRFADSLRGLLVDNELSDADDVLTVTDPNTEGNVTATFTFTSPGLYLILDQTAIDSKPAEEDKNPVAGSTRAVPILAGTELTLNSGTANEKRYAEGTAEMKNDVLTIDKTVNGSDHDSVQVGDYAKYQISTQIPQYAGYKVDGYRFTITDKFKDDAPLQYVSNDENHPLTVTVNGQELTKDVDYTVNGFTDESKTFTIDLTSYIVRTSAAEVPATDETFINADLAGAEVMVTYYAVVTDSTPAEGAINTATVTYPNDPTDNTEYDELPSPEAKVFNFDYTISKVDHVTGDKLQGATFAIYEKGSGNFLQKSTTGKDGVVKFYGLKGSEKGVTYTIKEIAAPAGYVNVGVKFDVTIKAKIEGENANAHVASVTYETDGDTWNLVSGDNSAMVTVENVKSVTQLPLTGAAGTMLFTVLGLLIAGTGALVYVKSRNVKHVLRG